VKVSSLSTTELRHELRQQGISLRIGPFVIRLQSPIPDLATGVGLLYADYHIETDSTFVDFHVRLAPPGNLRRWFRPQVLFFFDGRVPFKPLPLEQAFPFFEWGLNWCVAKHANQYLILHGAVVEKGGHAIIMAGPPGCGKSTLCAGLVVRGWRLLSDELALITPKDGQLTALPRPVSLKNQSIHVLRDFAPHMTIGRECADTAKGVVAHMKVPGDSVVRAHERAIPTWVIRPRYDRGTPAKLQGRSKAQTFMYVVKNAFNYSVLGVTGFETAAALIDACDCYDFRYSSLSEGVRILDALEPPASRDLCITSSRSLVCKALITDFRDRR